LTSRKRPARLWPPLNPRDHPVKIDHRTSAQHTGTDTPSNRKDDPAAVSHANEEINQLKRTSRNLRETLESMNTDETAKIEQALASSSHETTQLKATITILRKQLEQSKGVS